MDCRVKTPSSLSVWPTASPELRSTVVWPVSGSVCRPLGTGGASGTSPSAKSAPSGASAPSAAASAPPSSNVLSCTVQEATMDPSSAT